MRLAHTITLVVALCGRQVEAATLDLQMCRSSLVMSCLLLTSIGKPPQWRPLSSFGVKCMYACARVACVGAVWGRTGACGPLHRVSERRSKAETHSTMTDNFLPGKQVALSAAPSQGGGAVVRGSRWGNTLAQACQYPLQLHINHKNTEVTINPAKHGTRLHSSWLPPSASCLLAALSATGSQL